MAAVAIVVLWPPTDGKSLAVTFVNWVVDPGGRLPVLPPQLPLGEGDDPRGGGGSRRRGASGHVLYAQGGWTRWRLQLKVADQPIRPGVMRQLLTAAAVILAALTWRVAARRE